MTDTNIKDTAKKIFNEQIKDKLSVRLNSEDEILLKYVIEYTIALGLKKGKQP